MVKAMVEDAANIDHAVLPKWVATGARFMWCRNLWHVRAIVDGGAVCRRWRTTKQRWQYEWFDPFMFAGDLVKRVTRHKTHKKAKGP